MFQYFYLYLLFRFKIIGEYFSLFFNYMGNLICMLSGHEWQYKHARDFIFYADKPSDYLHKRKCSRCGKAQVKTEEHQKRWVVVQD